jgi:hypothetical protein
VGSGVLGPPAHCGWCLVQAPRWAVSRAGGAVWGSQIGPISPTGYWGYSFGGPGVGAGLSTQQIPNPKCGGAGDVGLGAQSREQLPSVWIAAPATAAPLQGHGIARRDATICHGVCIQNITAMRRGSRALRESTPPPAVPSQALCSFFNFNRTCCSHKLQTCLRCVLWGSAPPPCCVSLADPGLFALLCVRASPAELE